MGITVSLYFKISIFFFPVRLVGEKSLPWKLWQIGLSFCFLSFGLCKVFLVNSDLLDINLVAC